MAKRSPILGYNHNVLYRGLVFHVQTEDSGVMSPHLFTHLFHHGVIISTRKLVYDSGSGEDSIKSLMQAQHKAVLKDLKRGVFDSKIDEYLAGTPGLLPRGTPDVAAPDAARSSAPQIELADTKSEPIDLGTALGGALNAIADLEASTTRRDDTLHDLPPEIRQAVKPHALQPAAPRTQTAERTSSSRNATSGSMHDGIDGPTLQDTRGVVAASISAANNATIRTESVHDLDSAPEIEIQLELDDDEPRRSNRDTDVSAYDDHTRPTMDVSSLAEGVSGMPPKRQPGESIPPLPAAPNRAVGAASLPPARPITRPPPRPAITPQQVLTRPLTNDDPRNRGKESDAVEVYAPAPPSADAPPGLAGSERPGQYAQHKRSGRIPIEAITREKSGAAIPPGLGRPGRVASPSQSPTPPVAASVPPPIPQSVRNPEPSPRTAVPPPVPLPRTVTPTRSSPGTPAPSRTGSNNTGGVVMTRPAVIVGAPAKPSGAPRVRKAREDEGRGFGHGLISEKSLDEVILAYLSEDADDK